MGGPAHSLRAGPRRVPKHKRKASLDEDYQGKDVPRFVRCGACLGPTDSIEAGGGVFDALPAFFTSEKVVAGTMSESFVVASCAASFGVLTHEPVERLEAAGCVVKVNPLGRAMKDLEMI